jgi:hypothetical protein
MHHLINQNSLPFNPHHTGSMITTNHQQFYPSPSIQQYNNYHYINHPYSQDNSNVYHSDRQVYFSNHHSHQTYPSYDSNNNYSDYQQYGLLRPVMESEHYSSYYDNEHTKPNENLLHNLNTKTQHYTDLSSITTNGNYGNNHHRLNEKKEDEHLSVENNYHWNQTACSTTQW